MVSKTNVNQAKLWKPGGRSGLTLFKASFTTFAFDRHTHDEYAIGVIEKGAQRFSHKGTSYTAPPSAMITVNPGEPHDGEAQTPGGYRYRMIYLELPLLEEFFDGQVDRKGLLAFRAPVTRDSQIARRFHRVLAYAEKEPGLIDEILPPVLCELFNRHATSRALELQVGGNSASVKRAIDLIRSSGADNISLDTLASEAGLSKYHFLRLFKKETGVTPHAYIVRRRVELARKALEEGYSPAAAAHIAGFADQSHLTRRFKTVYGVTPGSLAQG